MTKAYLDIDGVLLGKFGDAVVLAKGAEALVDYLLAHYECYWLTTHCRGGVEGPLAYLRHYADEPLMTKLREIKATNFDVYKTEAIELTKDFIWIDDAPLRGELDALAAASRQDCWFAVNTYLRPNDLIRLLDDLDAD